MITDVKVVAKRRFAFVGYRNNEEAARVQSWLQGSMVGGMRVKVEEVREEVSAHGANRGRGKYRDIAGGESPVLVGRASFAEAERED